MREANDPLTHLHRLIINRFSLDELRTLCFHLGVNYDDLPGEALSGKARELILRLGQKHQLDRLLNAIAQTRPDLLDEAILDADLAVLYARLPAWKESTERSAIQRVVHILTGGPDEQRALRNRRAMLQLVRNTWIKGVLEQSLHGAAMIELGMEERADAVKKPWDMVLQMPDRPSRTLPPGTKMIDVFEMNRALLILGEPGSGKTTMLLELARETIDRAEQDPMQPIPVVFNLSSWAAKEQSISVWLVDELNAKYNIPKKLAISWVENDDLLLLLDGLDEVKLERREACVKAINDFHQEHGFSPLVICSRVADYEALTNRLKLQGAVLLQPLTPQQVDRYLAGASIELQAVRATLQHDSVLHELAQLPLMLNIMTLAYRGMSVEDLGTLDTIDVRRDRLFDAYVQQMFERRRTSQLYSSEQTIRWLAWLAQKMSQHTQTVFLIEQMQPSWLQSSTEKSSYYAILGVAGCMSGLGPGCLVGLSLGAAISLILFRVLSATTLIICALIYALVVGLLEASIFISKGDIETVDKLKWSWKAVGEASAKGPPFIMSGKGFFLFALSQGIQSEEIEVKLTPNQGIKQSAKNSMIVMAGVALLPAALCALSILCLSFATGDNLKIQDVVALFVIVSIMLSMYGLPFGLEHGGLAFIQHWALRSTLYRRNCIPWNYVRFLDYATERIFLRKVGGSYIFIHRSLLEYFAELGED